MFLIGLAALIAALQLPVLLMGLNRTVSNEGLHNEAMRAADVLERLLRFMSNGLLDPAPPVGALLTILLPLALLLAILLHLRSGKRAGATAGRSSSRPPPCSFWFSPSMKCCG